MVLPHSTPRWDIHPLHLPPVGPAHPAHPSPRLYSPQSTACMRRATPDLRRYSQTLPVDIRCRPAYACTSRCTYATVARHHWHACMLYGRGPMGIALERARACMGSNSHYEHGCMCTHAFTIAAARRRLHVYRCRYIYVYMRALASQLYIAVHSIRIRAALGNPSSLCTRSAADDVDTCRHLLGVHVHACRDHDHDP